MPDPNVSGDLSHVALMFISGSVEWKSFHSIYQPYLMDVTREFDDIFQDVTGRSMVPNLVRGGLFGATLLSGRKVVFSSLNSMGSMTSSPVPSCEALCKAHYSLHGTTNLVQIWTGLEVEENSWFLRRMHANFDIAKMNASGFDKYTFRPGNAGYKANLLLKKEDKGLWGTDSKARTQANSLDTNKTRGC